METTPEANPLFDELVERMEALADLTGPQIEGWASGLFPLFEHERQLAAFAEHVAATGSTAARLLVSALVELSEGVEPGAHAAATTALRRFDDGSRSAVAEQIGSSRLTASWRVSAPFGSSIVLGFENSTPLLDSQGAQLVDEAGQPVDLDHSILVEMTDDGHVFDLQLAGPAGVLLEEAAAGDQSVTFEPIQIADALEGIEQGWPTTPDLAAELGPGFSANQAFLRRRMLAANAPLLPVVSVPDRVIDIRRGLDEEDYQAANRAALSTLRAAVRIDESAVTDASTGTEVRAWIGVIRGDGGELSGRERDGLLWLEWADWLGAGIGLLRAGVDSPVSGAALVDHVNSCPEVSSTIDKRDREYAEWAFEVAIDLLADAEIVVDARLTSAGHQSLGPALVVAWSGPPD